MKTKEKIYKSKIEIEIRYTKSEIEQLHKQNNLTILQIKKLLAYHQDEFEKNQPQDAELYWYHSDAIEMYSDWVKKHYDKLHLKNKKIYENAI